MIWSRAAAIHRRCKKSENAVSDEPQDQVSRSFRPFAPAVLAERVGEFFNRDQRYMLIVAEVHEHRIPPDPAFEGVFGIEKLKHLIQYTGRYSSITQRGYKQYPDNSRFHELQRISPKDRLPSAGEYLF